MNALVVHFRVPNTRDSTGQPEVLFEGQTFSEEVRRTLNAEFRERWNEFVKPPRVSRKLRFNTQLPGVPPQTEFLLTFSDEDYTRSPGLRFEAIVPPGSKASRGETLIVETIVKELRTIISELAIVVDHGQQSSLLRAAAEFEAHCRDNCRAAEMAALAFLGFLSQKQARLDAQFENESSRINSLRQLFGKEMSSLTAGDLRNSKLVEADYPNEKAQNPVHPRSFLDRWGS